MRYNAAALRSALLCAIAALPLRAQPPRAPLSVRLDSITRAWVAEGPAASVSVAVVRGQDTLLLEAVGERDRDTHAAATTGTIYRIGSITKQFTSAAVMQLVEQGKIALTDPLTKYLPEYPQWSGVTMRELLNHTSGIHSYTADRAWRDTWSQDLTPAQVVAFVAKDTLDFPSGTQWRYNNTGYMLLGMILERVTGVPYADYVQQHFFKPLGMQSAAYCPSKPTDAAYAAGYDLRAGTVQPAIYLSMTHPYAAGALCMSVPDYLKWQAALTSGRIVTPATYALMSRSDTVSSGRPTNYGFGLAPAKLGTHAAVTHNGGVNGFNTDQWWFPDDSLRVVAFTNTTGTGIERLTRNLASAVLGMPLLPKPPAAPAPVPLAATEYAKYVGTYDLQTPGGKFTVRIFEENGVLMTQAEGPGQGKIPLIYIGNDTFGAAFDPSLRLTVLFEGGKATSARLMQGGNVLAGPRRP